MAKVLQNFLIGVGLDTEKYDKGSKKVESSLERMRSLVGFTGSAIAGAFGAVGLAAISAGNRVDKSMLAWEKFKTPPAWINAYGHAVAQLGGDFEDAANAISSIEKAQADLKLKGLLGPLEDVALARGDINALSQTQNGAEFLRTLAPMVQNMNKDQQRLVQETLSLSDGVMRSLRDGVDQLDDAVAKAAQLYGEFGKSTEAAREYNRALAKLNTQFQGIGETLTKEMLPGFTGILNSFGNFIETNKGTFSKGIDIAAENPLAATGAVVGGSALLIAALKGVGMLTRAAGPLGLAISGGATLLAAGLELYEQSQGGGAVDKAVAPKKEERWWDKLTIFDTSKDIVTSRSNPKGRKGGGYGWSDITTSSVAALGDLTYEDIAASKRSNNPIYSGGEISNMDAANVNPNVVMLREARRSELSGQKPQTIKVQNHIDIRTELDGKQIDNRITEVVERRERDTIGDITSSVER